MRFINGNIFVNGRFVSGGFSVAHGRFTHVLAETADGESVDLHGAYVIPGDRKSTRLNSSHRT